MIVSQRETWLDQIATSNHLNTQIGGHILEHIRSRSITIITTKILTNGVFESIWSRLDDLQSTRVNHRAIINGSKVYVVGGNNARWVSNLKSIRLSGMISTFSFRYTEIWSDDQGSKSIKLAEPNLNGYYHYPELILVDTRFCVNPWIKVYFK